MSAQSLRIAAFHWAPYALPFARPFVTAAGHLRERRGFVVRLQDERGAWGVGEAAPLPAFGGETLAACETRLARWGDALPGCSVELPDALAEAAPAASPLLTGLGTGVGSPADLAAVPSACHGLECALLDLAAQRAGLPLAHWLARLLGTGPVPAAVTVNATLGAAEPAQAVEAARAAVAQGISTLKLKVGERDSTTDLRRLQAVRNAVDPAVRLRIDANGAWSRQEADERLRQWAPLALEYVEQPVPADDLDGLAWLSAHAPVAVAADESVRTCADAVTLLERRAAAVLVLKPMWLGGALTALTIARQALAQRVAVVMTTALEGIYGRLAALHVSAVVATLHTQAGLPLPPPACGLATGGLLTRDLAPHPPGPVGGAWALPPDPGLGLP